MKTVHQVDTVPEPCSSEETKLGIEITEPSSSHGTEMETEMEITVYSSPVSCSDKPWCKSYAVFQSFNNEMEVVEKLLRYRMQKILQNDCYWFCGDVVILKWIKRQMNKLNSELELKIPENADNRRTTISVAFFNAELTKVYVCHTGSDHSGVVLGVQDGLKWKGECFLGQPEKEKQRFEVMEEDIPKNQGLLKRFRSLFAGRKKLSIGNTSVAVLELDTKVHRCLILGTGKLWTGLNIHQAVNIIYSTEKHNRHKNEEPSPSDASAGLSTMMKLDPAAMLVRGAHLRSQAKLASQKQRKKEAETNLTSEENGQVIAQTPAHCVPAIAIAMVFTPVPILV